MVILHTIELGHDKLFTNKSVVRNVAPVFSILIGVIWALFGRGGDNYF